MQYRVFDQNLWLFPDIYRTDGKDEGEITLLKGQTGAFQVQLSGLPVGASVHWTTEGLDGVKVQLYREKEICVNRNTGDMQFGGLTTENWELVSRHRIRRRYCRKAPPQGFPYEERRQRISF